MTKPTEALVYDRVSDPKQVKGVMLDARNEKLTKHVEERGWVLVDYLTDPGFSAREGRKRPGFDKAMDLACQPGRVLVVDSLTRFSRSLLDACNALKRLNSSGAGLVVVSQQIDTTTPGGMMVFNIMAAVSQFESDLISSRIKSARQYIKDTYKVDTMCGAQPWGKKLVGNRVDGYKIVDDEDELEAMVTALEWAKHFEHAHYRWKRTATHLNNIGAPTPYSLRNRRKGEPDVPWNKWNIRYLWHEVGLKGAKTRLTKLRNGESKNIERDALPH